MLVPQAMAYALLAGLPVEVGLYASPISYLYMPLGDWSSGWRLVQWRWTLRVVASINAVSSGMSSELSSDEQVTMAALLALMVGLCLVLMEYLNWGEWSLY